MVPLGIPGSKSTLGKRGHVMVNIVWRQLGCRFLFDIIIFMKVTFFKVITGCGLKFDAKSSVWWYHFWKYFAVIGFVGHKMIVKSSFAIGKHNLSIFAMLVIHDPPELHAIWWQLPVVLLLCDGLCPLKAGFVSVAALLWMVKLRRGCGVVRNGHVRLEKQPQAADLDGQSILGSLSAFGVSMRSP